MLGLEQFISFNMKSFISFLFSMCLISAHAERLVVNVGDIVDISGHKAIVFSLDDTGEHGKAMYVGAFRGVDSPWCSNGKHARKLQDMLKPTMHGHHFLLSIGVITLEIIGIYHH